jgi:hypothetical protein
MRARARERRFFFAARCDPKFIYDPTAFRIAIF